METKIRPVFPYFPSIHLNRVRQTALAEKLFSINLAPGLVTKNCFMIFSGRKLSLTSSTKSVVSNILKNATISID